MSDLNQRAAKALAGRWRPRMATIETDAPTVPYPGPTIIALRPGFVLLCQDEECEWVSDDEDGMGGLLPDMDDAATRGAYLDVVREAWGLPTLSPHPWQGGWEMVSADEGGSDPGGWWATEAEALVAALEAAPPGTP